MIVNIPVWVVIVFNATVVFLGLGLMAVGILTVYYALFGGNE